MQRALALALAVLQCCDICGTIRVPVVWDSDSEVTQTFADEEPKTSADKIQPQNLQQPVPVEYFQYTAKKPQFAVDIAKFHGYQSPEEHFKAHPIKPYTGKEKPELGKHRLQDSKRPVFKEFQEYVTKDEDSSPEVKPVSTNYEVFHPYKAEEPGFQELYKDPVLEKIRNDIRDSSQRLHTYENEAGKPNIESGEYLESIDETDRKKFPHRNVPVPYEIHRPQRRPVYYRPPPRYSNRDHILNQRLRHPWNQHFAKIRPMHYVPLQNHIHRLRQNHALKYDDEHNEYPQIPVQQHYEEPSDGYDIYEKGKAKFVNLRNNLDESINNVVKESRPSAPQKLELQLNEQSEPDEEEEFVPLKNYAQVRKTETTKHVPKTAAFDDAESYEEIKNAPRLREAIKSTKAQTVYTEEGYEDSAYDHAGEQKHASDHEAHGGYLKENELSGGKYKTPSVSTSSEDGKGVTYRDQTLHGEKWKDINKDSQKEEESEDYSEDENEKSVDVDYYNHGPVHKNDNQRNKREDDSKSVEEIEEVDSSDNVDDSENNSDTNKTTSQHDVNKRETSNFKVPDINLDSVFLKDKDILEIAKAKIITKDDIQEKYPYYFKDLKAIHKNSPLRYAENIKLIPKKSNGGTEFYDSRSHLECPEVEDAVDAIPDKLKKNTHPDESNEETGDEAVDQKKGESVETSPRLAGLGDKIDCFKAKYFGENPLDSPFFKEEIISNPEPIIVPNLSAFKLKTTKITPSLDAAPSDVIITSENLRNDKNQSKISKLLEASNSNKTKGIDSDVKGTEELKTLLTPLYKTDKNITSSLHHTDIYQDIVQNIKQNLNRPFPDLGFSNLFNKSLDSSTVEQSSYQNNNKIDIKVEDGDSITHNRTRNKRGAPFVYEPYKIIRDVQVPDSKKTTTTGNISPLIKQLQSSKVIDTVVKDQPVKRTVSGRNYKNIGRNERQKIAPTDSSDVTNIGFVDVNVDKRRGEPRYELRPSNHRSQYSPINNTKSMSLEDYESRTKQKLIGVNEKIENLSKNSKPRRPAARALYDISRFLPKTEEIQKSAASNTVKTTVATSPAPIPDKKVTLGQDPNESEEDYYEEYDDDEEETHETSTTTTTTTTPKPIFRKKIRSTTTTEKEEEVTENPPKLRLITRFNPPDKIKGTTERPHKPAKKFDDNDEPTKYREKKKKITKSTLVTDSKKYGDEKEEDDMRKEEIDALIGVKHDMDEYTPMYEKEADRKNKKKETLTSEQENSSEEEYEDDDNTGDDDDDDDDNDDDDEDGDDNEEDNSEEEEEEDGDEENTTSKSVNTTTELPKRSLVRTTDAPLSTTESKRELLETKPVVSKKKIEIHKELPVNKSSPHTTQYKQDIKEVEIIKELPRKSSGSKQNKNLELLDFYKDENLAKDVNQLGGVEIFKEDLDIKKGPKHGGNYRRAPDVKEEIETTTLQTTRRRPKKPAKDALTSQTENKKQIELNDDIPAKRLHGGNLKSIDDMKRFRGHGKSEQLIELDENDDNDTNDESISLMHGGNFRSNKPKSSGRSSRMHGGNYRSAKLLTNDNEKGETKSLAESAKLDTPKNARVNAAVLLNSSDATDLCFRFRKCGSSARFSTSASVSASATFITEV